MEEEVQKAVRLYECIGSWWTYEDKIPLQVKEYLAKKYSSTVEEVSRIAEAYVEPMYSRYKPDRNDPGFAKDWG